LLSHPVMLFCPRPISLPPYSLNDDGRSGDLFFNGFCVAVNMVAMPGQGYSGPVAKVGTRSWWKRARRP